MASVTGLQVRDRLVERGIIQLLGTTTALAGGANRLRDATRLQSVAIPSASYDGCWVRITSGTYNGTDVLVDYLDSANGDLYISPSTGAAVASGVTYEIFRLGVLPDDVDRARDRALQSICSRWALQVLSEVTNADYQDALASANWVAQNGATAAIAQPAFPSQYVPNTIVVTNNAQVNGQVRSASIYTRPTRTFYLYVPVSIRTGTAELIVRDVTNGANITLTGSSVQPVGRGWTGIEVTGTIPAASYEIQVWLRGDGANDIVEWGPVSFHWKDQYFIGVPDRIVTRDHVGGLFGISNPMEVGSANDWGEDRRFPIGGVRRVQVGDRVRLELDSPLEDRPYYFEERLFYSALSTAYQTVANRTTGDAATTTCPIDYVSAATARLLAELYVGKLKYDAGFWADIHAKARAYLETYERRFGPEPKPQLERDGVISIPHLRV